MIPEAKMAQLSASSVVPELTVQHRRISLLGVEGAFLAARRPTLRAPVVLLAISTILGIPIANLAVARGIVEGAGGVAFAAVGFAFAWALYRLLWAEESHALVLRRNGHDEVVLRTRDAPLAARLMEEIQSQLGANAHAGPAAR